jgi:hypothetical protein
MEQIKTVEWRRDEVCYPSENAAFRQIGNELVIVDTLNNYMMTLNRTGAAIWSLLDGRTIDDIATEITNRFDVALSQARDDVASFMTLLHERGLLSTKHS